MGNIPSVFDVITLNKVVLADQELLKRETSFSTFRNLSLLIISWNMDAAKPDALEHDLPNISFLNDVLTSVDSPDIISFGFQEVIDLESRRMTAKTVLLGGKKKGHDDGKISEKVTPSYKRWHDRLVQAVRLAMPPNSPYTVIETENLVGLFSCMFIKSTERTSLKDVAITTIKRGMGGRYGNKVRRKRPRHSNYLSMFIYRAASWRVLQSMTLLSV